MKTTLTMSLIKLFGAALPALALAGLGLAGCESHYTTQEAYITCNELLSNSAIDKDNPEVFADCVACHEDCGTDCSEQATSPATYTCPDEEGVGGGDGSGGGS